MSAEKPQGTGGLSPQYQTYERQKCFIAYTEQVTWSEDLLSACREVLSRSEFNLEPDYARKHFDPDIPLRQKALELIANARYGIYDLSYWRDEEGEWQMPHNVFIELGMAIALNRPTLLLRHANNREVELPECLKSVSGHVLEFSGETTLKRALEERLPQWVKAPPERDWWNRYCIFGGRVCEYREAHPRARQWGQKTLRCHISDGPDVDRDDFRGVVEEVLGRFSDVTFDYLDALPVAKGRNFLLCTCCQTVRSTPFAIYRITPHTPADTFIAIGMSIALESQFEYKIPKILLTEKVQDVPSLLSGYEVVAALSDKERKACLRESMPTVMQKVREMVWKPRPLPFVGIALPVTQPEQLKPLQVEGGAELSQTIRYALICPVCGSPEPVETVFCTVCGASLADVEPSAIVQESPLSSYDAGDLPPLTALIDRYVVLEKIAQGGMGAIYKAQDKRLQGKIIAVKEMSEPTIAPADRKLIVECFRREAQLLARLKHPNLVYVTDLFDEGDRHYMVMELIKGKTLQQMLERRTTPFTEEQVLVWADQLCDVLCYLHSLTPKIIYRDMKPANVMVVDNTNIVKLIDFGIARLLEPGKRRETIEFGTSGYAAPEQYGKSQTDERTDIYGLGGVLHHLLTLRNPTTAPFQFPRVRSLNPKVSRRMEAAIAKAVQPDKAKRYQSVEEMRVALLGH